MTSKVSIIILNVIELNPSSRRFGSSEFIKTIKIPSNSPATHLASKDPHRQKEKVFIEIMF